jgi:pyruvate/2-oxoglutarate dehydrogenase complex dihydrolipoamide dehydrogenase (E3) component
VVIGAGSAGLVSAYLAAAMKAKVSLIEKHKMGGDCLNTGCIPSKALIRSARFIADAQRADSLGFTAVSVEFEFADIMDRVQRVIHTVEPRASVERYTQLGVDCIQGEAKIISPYAVEINNKILTTRSIIIATGAEPLIPLLPGLEAVDYLTSDTVWELRQLPKRLLVLGAGPIGCELAQCFARFGAHVTMVDLSRQILPREDPEISGRVAQQLTAEGVDLRLGYQAKAAYQESQRQWLICQWEGQEVSLEFDALLVAVGRRPNVKGLGLEALEIPITRNGNIEVNEFLQTLYPNVYACGDVAGPYQFTHTASHQAWYATVNALFGGWKRFKVDYSIIPWATFTDPEVARVGFNEREAKAQGVPFEVTTFSFSELDRAITDEATEGVIKVLTVPGKDKILGVTVTGKHAGDLIIEFIAAMRHGFGLNKILSTIHIYPTLAEANKYVAGAWRRAHLSEKLLRGLACYHAWRRGARLSFEK